MYLIHILLFDLYATTFTKTLCEVQNAFKAA